jgi:hypothetical protein
MDDTKIVNCMMTAPGLAIGGGSKYTAKHANTIYCKANGIIGTPKTTADVSALTTSVGKKGTTNELGTTVLATLMARYYTVLATVNPTTSAVTLSLVHGEDFSEVTDIGRTKYINRGNDGDETKAIVGYFCVINGSGSNFTPGSTALDASSITTMYQDQFGFDGR